MTRTTLAMAKASRIPEAVNLRPGDSRFLQYLNDGIQRCLYLGKWWGTYQRYAVSIDSQNLVPPPHIDTIETIAVARTPLPIRSQWFEFLGNGWGTRDETLPNGSGINECLLRGSTCTFKELPTPSVLTLKCDLDSDVGKSVRVFGKDVNGNWVRTETAGVWDDGEVVVLAKGAGTTTLTQFSVLSDLQGPTNLDGQWWLYAGDVATGIMIGRYEYWETNPQYKRYIVPFISTDVSTVELMGKVAFRPVAKDTDYLLIGHLGALKLAAMAIKAEEEHNWAEADLLWNGGDQKGIRRIGVRQLLDAELSHHRGDGEELGIHLSTSGQFSDPIESIV